MGISDEEMKDAQQTQALVCQKLREIIDLQGDIDGLLRESYPSPFDSGKLKNARPEELQRIALMAAVQFVLYEPENWVVSNDQFKNSADELLKIVTQQLQWLKKKYH